jgi:uncharacterized RDD family membrane protein YckC
MSEASDRPARQEPGAVAPPPKEALAGFWARGMGMAIDEVVLGLGIGIVWGMLPFASGLGRNGFLAASFLIRGAYFTYFHASPRGQTLGNRAAVPPSADGLRSMPRWWLLPLLVVGWVFRATAGVFASRPTGVRVVDATTGGPVTYARAFVRSLVSFSYVPALPTIVVVAYVWMVADPRNQTVHDKAANTLVVRAERYPPA